MKTHVDRHLAVPVSLTLVFLNEHLHAFRAAHPGIELELRLSDRTVDLVRDGIDVALRRQAQLTTRRSSPCP